jgi:hypothetical protein
LLLLTIPADVAAPHEQEFNFSGVVGSLPLIYVGQMFHKTCDQMNNWRWDNPHAFGDQVDHSNPLTTRSGKVKRTGERFPSYGSDDLRAKIELPSCRQSKPGDFLDVRPLNWDEIINEDDDDDN